MKKNSVLLVEDELIIGLDIKRTLETMGYTVTNVISSGEDAVKAAKKDKPDIILMDIVLAGDMSGIDAAKKIREFYDVPIIYLTANVDELTIDAARDTLPAGYLNKPVGRRDLQSNIDTAIYRYLMEKKARESDRRFRELFENIRSGVLVFRRTGDENEYICSDMNKSAETILKLSFKEAEGKKIKEIFPPGSEPGLLDFLTRVAETGDASCFPATGSSHGAKDLWIDFNAYTLDNGELVVVFDDVTERVDMINEINNRNIDLDSLNIQLNSANTELESLNEELQASLEEMEASTEELLSANSMLAQTEERYRILFMNAPVGIFHYNSMLIITEINNRFAEILQAPRGKLIGLDMNTLNDKRILPVLSEPFRNNYGEYEGEYLSTISRVAIRIQMKTVPVFDENRNIESAIGIVMDVTSAWDREQELHKKEDVLKKLLHEKDIYIKEIHHRVKNNLQVVTSLIGLQAMKCGNREAEEQLTTARNRINAMALIQENIYQHKNLASVDFDNYLRTLAFELYHTYSEHMENAELKLDTSEVILDVNKAVPLAIIANELITNACKHAFADVCGERCYILVYLKGDDDTVELAIEDNGRGLPGTVDPESSDTLGLTLVSLELKQLGGKLEVDKNGRTRISVKVKNLSGIPPYPLNNSF